MDLGGEEPTIEDCEDILWELDINGDGEISKQEILVLFKELIGILGSLPEKKSYLGNRKRKGI